MAETLPNIPACSLMQLCRSTLISLNLILWNVGFFWFCLFVWLFFLWNHDNICKHGKRIIDEVTFYWLTKWIWADILKYFYLKLLKNGSALEFQVTANGFIIVVDIPYPASCVFCSSSENIFINVCVQYIRILYIDSEWCHFRYRCSVRMLKMCSDQRQKVNTSA